MVQERKGFLMAGDPDRSAGDETETKVGTTEAERVTQRQHVDFMLDRQHV